MIRGKFTVLRGEHGVTLEPVAGDVETEAAFAGDGVPVFLPPAARGAIEDLVGGAVVYAQLAAAAAVLFQVFKYLLGQRVVPKGEGTGVVIGRAEMLDGGPSYLVRYTDQDGNPADGWWGEGALSPEKVPAGAADNAPAAPGGGA